MNASTFCIPYILSFNQIQKFAIKTEKKKRTNHLDYLYLSFSLTMVELNRTPKSMKRKRAFQQKADFLDKSSRYPATFHLSALTYKQALESLCISPQSVLISVPAPPNKTQFNTIAGDLFNLDEPIRKIPIKLMEQYHKQHTITHMQWAQKGNTVASVDETGLLALWHIEVSLFNDGPFIV